MAAVCFAPSDPIKFLGVPIEGTDDQFYSRLMELGFKNGYAGPFIAETVYIHAHTSMGRLDVKFRETPAQRISAVYNQLLKMFRDDNHYFNGLKRRIDYDEIPENEVLSPETVANKHHYAAYFLYFGQSLEDVSDAIADKLFSEYMSEETLMLNRKRMKLKENLEDLNEFVHDKLFDAYYYSIINKEKYDTLRDSFSRIWMELSGGLVLLRIDDYGPQLELQYHTDPTVYFLW